MNWFPLHVHSHYSLLDGLSKPRAIAERLVECGHAGSALTDHGSISGSIQFLKAMNDACKCGHQKGVHENGKGECATTGCACKEFAKAGLKPILGSEFYLSAQDCSMRSPENRQLSHLVVLAKNRQGWTNLIKATSDSNRPEHMYYKPRLHLERLASFSDGQFVCFSGHPGSDLANVLFKDLRAGYSARSREDALAQLDDDWEDKASKLALRYRELFGEANFFLEIQLIDAVNMPAAGVVGECLRKVAKLTGIPRVATCDAHYPRPEDCWDQRALLCNALDTTIGEAQRRAANDEDFSLSGFFRSSRYHIPTLREMEELHDSEELANSVAIAEMCEIYDVLDKPMLPQFDCPGGADPNEYLTALCRKGWKEKIAPFVPKNREAEYVERVKKELGVITGAGLSPYFLIVQDYVNYARHTLGCKVGKGRGSGAGSLVSFLTGITNVDPVRHDLLFERFYNAGRNSPGRVSLPDIDCDFPIHAREKVIDYVRKKYGRNLVCQMATFGRIQGKGALKDVFRAKGNVSFDEVNRITEGVPDESAIADKLQEMIEETGEASIIRWALENDAGGLKEWCHLDKDGNLDGPLKLEFEQAIRIEGTKRSRGVHPSGVVVSTVDPSEICPMLYDGDVAIAGMEMNDLEALGLVKFDILGLAALDKIQGAESIIRTGRI